MSHVLLFGIWQPGPRPALTLVAAQHPHLLPLRLRRRQQHPQQGQPPPARRCALVATNSLGLQASDVSKLAPTPRAGTLAGHTHPCPKRLTGAFHHCLHHSSNNQLPPRHSSPTQLQPFLSTPMQYPLLNSTHRTRRCMLAVTNTRDLRTLAPALHACAREGMHLCAHECLKHRRLAIHLSQSTHSWPAWRSCKGKGTHLHHHRLA